MITLEQILQDRKVTIPEREHNPFLLPDIEEVLKKIILYTQTNNPIWILWDFDTDWITATSSFVLGLKSLFPSLHIHYQVPEREEWHGLNLRTINYMLERWVKLVLTCDNASNDKELIQYARERWLEIIITDHHKVTLANSEIDYLLVNPEREWSKYWYSHLCWVWVVYKILSALEIVLKKQIDENTKMLIKQLTCIWTIVDMVPLRDENLYFITHFRQLFNQKSSPFIELLKSLLDYHSESGRWFWWSVGPLFNGAWRLWESNLLIQTIIHQYKLKEIGLLEKNLEFFIELNKYRKELTQRTASEVDQWIHFIHRWDYVVLINSDKIIPGLRRLIANIYLDNKVAFCWWPEKENPNHISCSVSNSYWIDLINFLSTRHYTVNVWGHIWAFWYTYKAEYQDEFINDLSNYIKSLNLVTDKKEYDYILEDLDINEVKKIDWFIWGTWLPDPVFWIKGTLIEHKVLKDKYSKYTLCVSNSDIKCSVLDWSSPFKNLLYNKEWIHHVELWINRFLGNESIQLTLSK